MKYYIFHVDRNVYMLNVYIRGTQTFVIITSEYNLLLMIKKSIIKWLNLMTK